jgi:DNA primase
MNAPEFKTLADPIFNSIINPRSNDMNGEIICETTEEHSHPSTTLITSTPQTGQPVPNQPIQGVSGASYAPMDTSPTTQTNPQLTQLFKQLQDTITAIIQLSTTHQQTQAQTDLEEAVSTTLENAQWFKDRVEENCAEAITDHDFDYEIGQNIERYMRNSFDANDHYDFDAEVRSRVEDEVESVIDGIVEEKVQELLEERLADLLEEKLANANITINF